EEAKCTGGPLGSQRTRPWQSRGACPDFPIRAMRAGTAWLMWSIPAALFLVAFFHRNAPGVMARDLMETFGVTGAVIGLLSSTYFYSYAGFMIPGGLLIDA